MKLDLLKKRINHSKIKEDTDDKIAKIHQKRKFFNYMITAVKNTKLERILMRMRIKRAFRTLFKYRDSEE